MKRLRWPYCPVFQLTKGARRVAFTAALACAAPALAEDPVVGKAEDPLVTVTDRAPLDSVLIATRKEQARAPRATSLEPISQYSEHEPELAGPEPEVVPPAEPDPAAEATGTPAPEKTAATEQRVAARDSRPAGEAVAERPQPARFQGLTVGQTTEEELISAWGEPLGVSPVRVGDAQGEVYRYEFEAFRSVEALVQDELVRVLRVTLAEPATVADLTTRLELSTIGPVEVTDPETGGLLGVNFPEKGLTLLTPAVDEPRDAEVSQLLIQPLDPQAFAARAESRPTTQCVAALADLKQALGVDPSYAHALWLEAGVRRAVGQVAPALRAAEGAAKLAPESPAYQLRLAECLADAGRRDEAAVSTRKVLDDADAPQITRAQALHTLGRLASVGDAKIAGKAIDFHTSAIEVADRLATGADDRERRAAKDLLVEAHLAIACEVARRDFGNKAQVVGEWIGRASGLAEERIASDGGGLELRLLVAREALSALASLKPANDPAPWVKEAEETAAALLAQADDKLFRARVEWELGEAHRHAVRVEHTRGDARQALRYGASAIDHLSTGAEPRATSPDAEAAVGNLYFYLGAVQAVHNRDHKEAVGWYDKARPILTAKRPQSEYAAPRQEGEALVSMGVSYWDQDQRELAVELTIDGAQLMERGVRAGVLEKAALGVPYGNLASMQRVLGDEEKAAEYALLAKNSGGGPATAVASNSTPAGGQAATKRVAGESQAKATEVPASRGIARRPAPRGTQVR